jgi:hypothetical protein
MSVDLYGATPRRTRRYIMKCIEAGIVPFVRSSPGMGKSTIMRSIAKHFNLCLIDIRLSTSQPEDLSGLPEFIMVKYGETERRIATFTPFDIFPGPHTPLPINPATGEPYDGWMVFFDEFNSAPVEMHAACYKVILDRIVGQMPLHERVVMTAAGNLMTDKAITNELSTAMQSRLAHIEMILSHEEWMEDVAFAEDYDERIIGYNNFDPDALMDFKPDHQDKTFNCPRTWEFMNRLVKDKPIEDEDTGLFAGTITSSHAAAFVQYSHIYRELQTVKDILADPEGAVLYGDHESNRQWGIVTHLMKHVDEKNFGDISKYVNRMGLSHRILFYRRVMVSMPQLRHHQAFQEAATKLIQWIKPDSYDAANAHRLPAPTA